MSKHLLEAIQLNFRRLGSYLKISGRRSFLLSIFLILSEVFVLPLALFLDLWSLFIVGLGYQKFSKCFVSMDRCPRFTSYDSDLIGLKRSVKTRYSSLVKDFRTSLRKSDPKDLLRKLETTFRLEKDRQVSHSMLIHLLESMIRAVRVIGDGSIKRTRFLKVYLGFQIAGLSLSFYLDRLALPLHKLGIPILIQDVPSLIEESK